MESKAADQDHIKHIIDKELVEAQYKHLVFKQINVELPNPGNINPSYAMGNVDIEDDGFFKCSRLYIVFTQSADILAQTENFCEVKIYNTAIESVIMRDWVDVRAIGDPGTFYKNSPNPPGRYYDVLGIEFPLILHPQQQIEAKVRYFHDGDRTEHVNFTFIGEKINMQGIARALNMEYNL
jgi:hypothetical protein